MKIVLVNPPITDAERFSKDFEALKEVKTITPPLGLCYLAGMLEKNGFNVEIIDAMLHCGIHNWSFERLINEIAKRKPDIVCITATTVTIQTAAKIAKNLKGFENGVKIIVGGPHVSVIPEMTMKEFPEFDIGVIGEGEFTLLELVRQMEREKPLDDVSGIIFRKCNKLVKTNARPLTNDIDNIPFPARHLLYDISLYKHTPGLYKRVPHIHMITSRGCPFRCVFCASNAIFGKTSRFHSTDYVMSEIKHVIEKHRAKELVLYDDMFTVNHKRVEEICNAIIKEKLDIVWSSQGRVNSVNKELLALMKKAGCWSISYGIESGDQEILNLMKKGITLDQVKKAVKWSKELDMYVRGFFMLGNAGETKETIEKTINFASSLNLDLSQFSITTPFPGTELWETAKQYGEFKYKDWSDFNTMAPLFVPNGLTADYLVSKTSEAFRRCHLKPKYILKRMLAMRSPQDIKKNWQGMKMVLKLK
ncbi:MAG: radical SAM protein [Nanoarchaeota archaeon]